MKGASAPWLRPKHGEGPTGRVVVAIMGDPPRSGQYHHALAKPVSVGLTTLSADKQALPRGELVPWLRWKLNHFVHGQD
jgi:hypothetical protein